MLGLMMDQPLLISDLIRHADRHHGDTEIVTKTVEDGSIHRYTYREAHRRSRRLAKALAALGVRMNDRVATLAWNSYRHFEIYYATAGIGRRDPHHQPAPVPRADRLHRQSRRGHGAVLRHQPRAAGGEARAAAQDGEGLRRDDRPGARCRKANIPNLHCYEELIDAPGRRFRVAVLRREDGRLPLLHLGHHGQSQGRALQPPLDDAARLRRVPARCAQPVGARRDPAGGADVPRQRLGPAVFLRADGREAGVSRPPPGRQEPARRCSSRKA